MRTEAAKPYSKLVAVLGPTNTGKTHRAITRMLEHPTGMLGLPLRLLAREIYDRLTRELGEQSVALITGEEKRVGQRARYWVCTVEAMPLTQEVDFIAVDEIQLAAHPQRGHIFTDRLLHARGRMETWFLGSDTMRPLLRALIPTANIESHPRLSTLKGKGQSRLSGLPSRTAVVAFSVPEVYRLAERLRHRRGGAAVVLGALSPRARNAQVALYEAREVDYLVATDAIGMGLNLAIRHVAFAGLSKFDGREERPLRPAELAQIAGRAGRHLQNGSFGTLAPVPPLFDGLRRCIEEHRFENVQQVAWRNSDLCMDSVGDLLSSLRAPPQRRYFSRLTQGSDLDALERLEKDAEVRRRAQGAAAVELLWQACQIPDYRQWLPELHAELVKEIFLQLTGPSGMLDQDWLATSIHTLDDVSGDIDALTARISSVRTWTYLSNHSAWLPSPAHWVERTRQLEDRLSDTLHERLVERFVARRRTAVDGGATSPVELADNPALVGSPFAVLQSLREQMSGTPGPTLESWVADLITAPHERFVLDATGLVFDGEECLGRLARGASLLKPEFRLTYEGLSSGQHLRLSRRLLAWARDLVQEVVGALDEPPPEPWSAAARGVIYQLQQNLGTLSTRGAARELAALTPADRQSLGALGVKINRDFLYLVDAAKPRQRLARLALTHVFSHRDGSGLPALMDSVCFRRPRAVDIEWLSQVGFVVLGHHVIRVDVADRLSGELRRCARAGAFALPGKLTRWLGPSASSADASELALALGYRCGDDGLYRRARRRRRGKRRVASS